MSRRALGEPAEVRRRFSGQLWMESVAGSKLGVGSPRDDGKSRISMKVATFNVNSLRTRLPIVLEWLSRHKPDVMCLQETKVQDQDFPAEAIRAAGYHSTYRGMKAYNG